MSAPEAQKLVIFVIFIAELAFCYFVKSQGGANAKLFHQKKYILKSHPVIMSTHRRTEKEIQTIMTIKPVLLNDCFLHTAYCGGGKGAEEKKDSSTRLTFTGLPSYFSTGYTAKVYIPPSCP